MVGPQLSGDIMCCWQGRPESVPELFKLTKANAVDLWFLHYPLSCIPLTETERDVLVLAYARGRFTRLPCCVVCAELSSGKVPSYFCLSLLIITHKINDCRGQSISSDESLASRYIFIHCDLKASPIIEKFCSRICIDTLGI